MMIMLEVDRLIGLEIQISNKGSLRYLGKLGYLKTTS